MASREDWKGRVGLEWSRRGDALDALLGPPAAAGLQALGALDGLSVLDLGCGAGGSTAELASRVGPQGHVLGVDVSPDLAEQARAQLAEVPNAGFIEADAEVHDFGERAFDALFSRFGSMFFERPEVAFANLHGALTPGAPTVFVAWCDARQNLWASIPGRFEAEGMERPAPKTGPGPFAWANEETFRPVLQDAGFKGITATEFAFKAVISEGDNPDPVQRAADFMIRIGPLAARLKGATDDQKKAASAFLTQNLAPHVHDGAVQLDALAWIISARA
ncbi:MAG: class I SAM-dependent methyltransferase [Pseudomonadota bacterium]